MKNINVFMDIGNSNLKFTFSNSRKNEITIININKINHKKINSIFKDKKINKVFISSVNKKIQKKIVLYFQKLKIKYKFISIKDIKHIDFKLIKNKKEIGQDLLAQMSKIDSETIVVSLGTNSVVYYINQNLEFIGCAILPGITNSIEILKKSTSIKNIKLTKNLKGSLGQETNSAITSGIINVILNFVENIKKEYKVTKKCKIIYSGGNSCYLEPYLISWIKMEYLEILGLINTFKN